MIKNLKKSDKGVWTWSCYGSAYRADANGIEELMADGWQSVSPVKLSGNAASVKKQIEEWLEARWCDQ